MRRSLALGLLALCGCADDVIPFGIGYESVCGVEGPTPIVELAADERVIWVSPFKDDAGSLVVSVGPLVDTTSEPWPEEFRRVVVDPCGQELGRTALQVTSLWSWQGHVLGCSLDENLLAFDDLDDPAPTVLVRGTCFTQDLGSALVARDEDEQAGTARVVAITPTTDGLVSTTILDDVQNDPGPTGLGSAVRIDGAQVFTKVAADDSVWSHDLATGQSRRELGPVSDFDVTASAFVYRPARFSPDGLGPTIVRDRTSGEELLLSEDVPANARAYWEDDLTIVEYGPGPVPSRRVFRLDPPREITPPAGTQIATRRDDGLMWLRQEAFDFSRAALFRWREGESAELAVACEDCVLQNGTSLEGAFAFFRLIDGGFERFELWQVRDEGGDAELVAGPLDQSFMNFSDGRILTVLTDGGEQGPLVVFDGDGSDGEQLAGNVGEYAPYFSLALPDPNDILFEGLSGDRPHALYRALLTPR